MREKDCYCHNCKKWYHHLGIARHRAKHRDRGETVKITLSGGDTTIVYKYGGENDDNREN